MGERERESRSVRIICNTSILLLHSGGIEVGMSEDEEVKNLQDGLLKENDQEHFADGRWRRNEGGRGRAAGGG